MWLQGCDPQPKGPDGGGRVEGEGWGVALKTNRLQSLIGSDAHEERGIRAGQGRAGPGTPSLCDSYILGFPVVGECAAQHCVPLF